MELVTLCTCWNSFEAEIVKTKLESAGIPCILKGEGVSNVKIGYGTANSAFSIPVLVTEADAERAKEILEEKE